MEWGLGRVRGRACEYTQRIARAFAARMLEVWMQIDSDENIDIKGPTGYISMGVKWGFSKHIHVRIERGARGPDPPPHPWKITKNIGFLSNTGRDSLKNHKATKPAFHVGLSSGRQRNAI